MYISDHDQASHLHTSGHDQENRSCHAIHMYISDHDQASHLHTSGHDQATPIHTSDQD